MGLKIIARQLLARAKATGQPQPYDFTQGRPGLHLTARYDNGNYILSLTRKTIVPSQIEEGLCRAFFGIPATAHREAVNNGQYRIIRLTWPDIPLSEQPVAIMGSDHAL